MGKFMGKGWKKILTAAFLIAGMTIGSIGIGRAATLQEMGSKYEELDEEKWQLVFQDEFNGAAVDTSKWSFTIGGGGFGNNEQQYYTSDADNVRVTDGKLIIQAIPESFGGENYTSAKLTTQEEWTYGRFEFRARLPEGQGLWPAIWMLPSDADVYGGEWPVCGEIDIMEYMGSQAGTVLGTLHYGNPWVYVTDYYYLEEGESFADDFHTFAMEWLPGEFRWYVDGELYQIQQNWYSADDGTQYSYPAPFDQDFYLMLNLAVGGYFPGDPDESTWTKDTFEIDYVRVYEYTGELNEVAQPEQTPFVNLLNNSSFENGLEGWSVWTENGSVFDGDEGVFQADLYTTLPNTWSTQLYQNVEIMAGTMYRLEFDMRSTMERTVSVGLEGMNNLSLFSQMVETGEQWEHYSFDFAPVTGYDAAKLLFFLGNVEGTENIAHSVYIDNVTLMPITEELVVNGDFNENLNGWTTWTENGSTYSYDEEEGCFLASMPTILPNAWLSQLYQMTDVGHAATYQLSFDIKSSMNRQITVAVEADGVSPALNQTLDVTPDWSAQTFTFQGGSSYSAAKLVFMLGCAGNTADSPHQVWIDNVELVKISE